MSKGDIIKTLIRESGLPITEIARRINVDRRTIYAYMKKDNWKPETLQQISIACNKDANYLLKKILDSNTKQGEDKQIKIEEPDVIYHNKKKNKQSFKRKCSPLTQIGRFTGETHSTARGVFTIKKQSTTET
ncbi:terminase gpP N-terminus-related DNA-binding protein [Labilibaculum sp.]|uniref:helix-turn-helix domain-containing protein n=1 Tax=Labilibaculum sp. TaxID=2060723 RepID=UPI002AA77DB4|nr:helix-turn-helix domain-containing protein [Labilibaculum sp.]